MVYEDDRVKTAVEDLLSRKCQKCPKKFSTLKQLKTHYLEHGFLLCNECIEHRRDFWNEIKLYKSSNIRDHKNGKLKEDGFVGHVYCIHCRMYLFDSDDAKRHCNIRHEVCNVCSILGMKHRYYNGFSELETHYRSAHYCCTFQGCQASKCYVFPYKTELFEHLNRVHRVNVKITGIADHGKCSLPVMNPFGREKARVHAVVLEPNGQMVGDVPATQVGGGRESPDTLPPRVSEIPRYLDRGVLAEERSRRGRRRAWMDRLCRVEADEVEKTVDRFLAGTMSATEAFDQVTMVVGGETALKLFESMDFGPKREVVFENIKKFRRDIIFPKFVASGQVVYDEPENKKEPGFKVIDLRRRK